MASRYGLWIVANNPKYQSDSSSCGKWVVEGSLEKIRMIFPALERLVGEGKIPTVKYSHKEDLENDPFPYSPPVMCVYADDRTKEKTLEELTKLGIKPTGWKYDQETIADWEEGGKLYEESKRQRERFKKSADHLFKFLK